MKPCDSCCPQIHCQPFQKIMSKFHLKQLATQDPYIDILQTYMQCIYDYVYSTFRVEMSNNGGTHFRKSFFCFAEEKDVSSLTRSIVLLEFYIFANTCWYFFRKKHTSIPDIIRHHQIPRFFSHFSFRPYAYPRKASPKRTKICSKSWHFIQCDSYFCC